MPINTLPFLVAAHVGFGVLGILAAWGVWLWLRDFSERVIKPQVIQSTKARQFLAGSEVPLAVLISFISVFFDVYKPFVWESPLKWPIIPATIIIFLVRAYFLVKGIIQWNKDQDSQTVKSSATLWTG